MVLIEFLRWLFEGTRGNIVSGVAAAIVSGWVVARVTYGFQKKLLKQQLAFQKQQGDADAQLRKEMLEQLKSAIAAASTNIAKAASRPPPSERIVIPPTR
jgi:uncharacterized protein HemX